MTSSPLILGPMMRYVDDVSASIWVETRDAARVVVTVADRSWMVRTFAVHAHHYALVHVDGLQPDSTLPYTVHVNGRRAWPAEHSDYPSAVIATLGTGHPLRMSFGSCRTSVTTTKTATALTASTHFAPMRCAWPRRTTTCRAPT